MIDRRTIQSLIDATRREPWDPWYAVTRFAVADLLEECGADADAKFTREGKLAPSEHVVGDGSGQISVLRFSANSRGGTAFIRLSRNPESDGRIIEQAIGDGSFMNWFPPIGGAPVGGSFLVSVGDETPAGLVFCGMDIDGVAEGIPLYHPRSIHFTLTARWMARRDFSAAVLRGLELLSKRS